MIREEEVMVAAVCARLLAQSRRQLPRQILICCHPIIDIDDAYEARCRVRWWQTWLARAIEGVNVTIEVFILGYRLW